MAITISGENNNDRILASDGVIDQLSGFNVVGVMTATSFTGDLTGDVTGNLTGNVTGNINNSTLLLQTGGTERVRILSDGKVGINTTAPTATLDISNTNSNAPIINLEGGTSTGGDLTVESGQVLQIGHWNRDTSTFTERFRIASDGKVGIGTDNPKKALHVLNGGGSGFTGSFNGRTSAIIEGDTNSGTVLSIMSKSSGYSGLFFGNESSEARGQIQYIHSSNAFRFVTSGGIENLILDNGKVGIGTDIPDSSLTIHTNTPGETVFNIHADLGSNNNRTFNLRAPASDSSEDPFVFQTGNSMQFKVDSYEGIKIHTNGKVGIGTDDPNMTFHVLSTSDDVARFQSTNAGNGSAITLDHIGGSPADNDIAGKVVFNGQDDALNSTTYADIKCITSDVSNGSETAHLDFSTRGLGSFQTVFRINRRSTASAPSYTTDDADGVILDVYNTGNPYPRYMNFIAKSAGNTDSNIGFWTEAVGGSPTEKLRITSDGKVGINDNNPANQLIVKAPGGSGHCSSAVHSGDASTKMSMVVVQGSEGRFGMTTNHPLAIYAGTLERLRIDSSGRLIVGGGTHAGGSALVVKGGNQNTYSTIGMFSNHTNPSNNTLLAQIRLGSNATAVGANIRATASGAWGTNDYPTRLDFYTTPDGSNNARQRLRIGHTGVIGINNNGNRTLHVQTHSDHGNIGVFAGENINSSNASTVFFLSTYRNENSGEYFMQFNKDQDNNGDGVQAVYRVTTRGDVKNKYNSYGSISDVSLKENIIDAKSQWDDIKAIKVRNFNFKTDPDTKLLGVVAQEIETVSAGLVEDTPDKDITKEGDEGTSTKSVKYSVLYMKAIKCLQEAQARIETLEAEVAALKGS